MDLFIKNTSLEKRSAVLQEQLTDKSLGDRLSSLEQEVDPKRVGGRVINTKKPLGVFDKADNQQSWDTSGDVQPFEIDEIKKVVNDDDSQYTKEKTEEKKSFVEAHDDEEDTTRISRFGDPLKIKKI